MSVIANPNVHFESPEAEQDEELEAGYDDATNDEENYGPGNGRESN